MKRRNVEASKYRKQFHFKKCKFGEGVYTSTTFVYLKFLLIWIFIMIADFMLEFRFEFLWPFWLLIRSLHDSFKYQGIVSDFNSFLLKMIYLTCNYISFSFKDIFDFFRINSLFIRLDLLLVSAGTMVIFCCKHLCMGTIRVAYRKRHMLADHISMALVCVYRSFV
jgi:hypothetical protein